MTVNVQTQLKAKAFKAHARSGNASRLSAYRCSTSTRHSLPCLSTCHTLLRDNHTRAQLPSLLLPSISSGSLLQDPAHFSCYSPPRGNLLSTDVSQEQDSLQTRAPRMPHTKLPPTPVASSDITALEKHPTLETAFVLPPSAMSSTTAESQADVSIAEPNTTLKAYQMSPPISPAHKPMSSSLRHKRTLSGTQKTKVASSSSNITASPSPEFTLPPPPQRNRKIIQMTPKATAQASSSGPSSNSSKSTVNTSTTPPKRKQPSATSAAGRKIARKTAHSIIERRRRSKMNEEFGVLKDMIPACSGQEMHKLAILQAGIEYMRYLEGCIGELKGRRKDDISGPKLKVPTKRVREIHEEEEEEVDEVEMSPKILKGRSRRLSLTTSEASPILGPTSATLSRSPHEQASRNNSIASISTSSNTSAASTPRVTPTQTQLTPSFGAIQFSPEIQRRSPYVLPKPVSLSRSVTSSPRLLPLPAMNAAMEFEQSAPRDDRDQEATATAALMMLTHDRRGYGGRSKDESYSKVKENLQSREKERPATSSAKKAMSVKDLLTS